MGRDISCKWKSKNAGVAILIKEKVDARDFHKPGEIVDLVFHLFFYFIFRTAKHRQNKEGPYIMIKVSIQEEGITIVNIYAPNIGAPQCIWK